MKYVQFKLNHIRNSIPDNDKNIIVFSDDFNFIKVVCYRVFNEGEEDKVGLWVDDNDFTIPVGDMPFWAYHQDVIVCDDI